MIPDKTNVVRRPIRDNDGTNGDHVILLTTLIDQVVMQIKVEEPLTYPEKLKGDPNKRSKDKYCRFHRDHSHDTADCYDLKQ